MPGLPYLRAEAVYAVRHEMATHARRRAVAAAPAPTCSTGPRRLGRRRRRRRADRPPSSAGTTDETARQLDAYRRLCAHEDERRTPPTCPRRQTAADRAARHTPSRLTDATTPIEVPGSEATRSALVVDLRDARRSTASATIVDAASPRRAATGGRWRCTGRSPARSPQLAAVVVRPTSTDEVAASLAVCNDARRPGHRRRRAQRRVRRGAPVLGGVVLDLTALAGIVDVDAISGVVDVLPGTFGTRPRGRAPRRARADASATARSRRPRRPSAAGSPAAAPASTRPATARSRTWSSASTSVLADGTRDPHRRRARAPPSGPTSPSCSSAREGTLGVITGARLRAHPVADRTSGAPRTRSRRSPTASRRAAASCSRGATPAVLRLYDAAESQRGHGGDGTAVHAARARRGRRRARRRDDDDRRRGVRSTPARATSDDALVDAWLEPPQRHLAPCRRLTRKGFVVDTMEIAAPWSRLADAVRRRRARRCMAVPHARGGHVPPVAQLPRRRLPLLHLRGHAAARRRSSRPTSRCGTPAQRAVLAGGGNLSPPPRRRPEPRPVRGRGARRGARRARRGQGGARPERHPEPRQARPALPVRRRFRGRDRTSAPRASIADVAAIRAGDRRLPDARRPADAGRRASSTRDSDGLNAFFFFGAMLGFVLGGGVRRVGPATRHAAVARRRHRRSAPTWARRACSSSIRLVRGDDVELVRRRSSRCRSVILAGVARRHPRQPAAGTRVRAVRPDGRPRGGRPMTRCSSSTSARPACGPRSSTPTLAVAAIEYRRLSPITPAPGLVEFDAAELAAPLLDAARAALASVGVRSTPSASPTSGRPRSSGTAPPASRSAPALGWQDLRTVGDCLMAKAEHGWPRRPEPVGDQGRLAPRQHAPARRPRPVLRHRRHLDRLDAVARARCTSPTRPTPAVDRAAASPTARRGPTTACAALRHPRVDAAHASSTPSASSATPPRSPGAPPIAALRRRPAGVARRPGLRAARPGQDHVRHRRHARPVHRTPAPRRAPTGTRPARSRSSPWRATARSPGASRRSCCRPARTSSGCATTSASSRPAPRATTSPRCATTPTASSTCRRCSGSAPPSGTTAPAARCSASPAAPAAPRSCGPCSRASPTAAPTSSRPPGPTAGSPSTPCASTAG